MGELAVVTGAASGLGRAVVAQLAATGTTSVAIVDIDLGAAQAAAAEIAGDVHAYEADVSDPAAVDRCIDLVVDELGAPTALVNAAAIQQFAHAHELDPALWNRIIGINLTGTFLMCRAVLPHMISEGRGAIVNIASTAGLSGIPYDAAYCAAKGGVVQLTRSLAIEYSPHRVRVNAVAPGGMQTPMLHVPFPPDASPELQKHIRRSLLGVAEPQQVADVVCFLLSDRSSSMTGSIVVADGGALA